MSILIGCEESQVVCQAFRKRGHIAYSCDLLPTRGNPEWHKQGDIMDVLRGAWYDLIILHPDCTAMAVSGNRWYGKGMKYHHKRIESINWTMGLWYAAMKSTNNLCMENPVSVIWSHINRAQYIQPWQFGHGETKKTGLALCGLPKLKPTNIVEGREQRIWRMPPSETRKRDRSETFQGIADAMAEQWG